MPKLKSEYCLLKKKKKTKQNMDSNIEWAQGKAKDGNFYLCSKWDSNFLAKCLVKSHDVNRCKVHYACKVMHKLLNGLAGCRLAGRPNDPL